RCRPKTLPLSWKLTHPSLKQGYTYKQWLTGNIPVQFFPRKAFAGATYKVQWSHPNDVMLDVYIFGKPADLGQAFFIELKPVTTDGKKQWLVSYVVPNGGAENVPALSPDSGSLTRAWGFRGEGLLLFAPRPHAAVHLRV